MIELASLKVSGAALLEVSEVVSLKVSEAASLKMVKITKLTLNISVLEHNLRPNFPLNLRSPSVIFLTSFSHSGKMKIGIQLYQTKPNSKIK